MNSKYKILVTNTFIFAIGNVLVKLVSFFLMPLYTSILTTEQYGVSELLNTTVEIVLPIATLCIVEALYRFSLDENTDYQAAFMNAVYVILVGDIIVAFACFIIDIVSNYEYIYSFLLLYITVTFYKLTVQFARGLGHVKRYAAYGVINALTLVLSNIILLVYLHGGVRAYLLSFSIGYGIAGLVALILSKEYIFLKAKKIDWPLLKKMLSYSIPNIPNMLSWWINNMSDRYIIILFWGNAIGGMYTAASKLPAVINLLSSIFQLAWQYSTTKEIGSKDNSSFFSNIFRGYSYLCITACAGLLVFNKLLSGLLLQADFYAAWKYVPLLLLAAVLGCFSIYFGTFYNALKNNRMLMLSTVAGAGVNIVLNFILIPVYEGIGAALATVISYTIVVMVRIIDIRRYIHIKIYYYKFILQLLLLGVSTILSTFGTGWIYVVSEIIIFILIVFSDARYLKKWVIYLWKELNNIFKGYIDRFK